MKFSLIPFRTKLRMIYYWTEMYTQASPRIRMIYVPDTLCIKLHNDSDRNSTLIQDSAIIRMIQYWTELKRISTQYQNASHVCFIMYSSYILYHHCNHVCFGPTDHSFWFRCENIWLCSTLAAPSLVPRPQTPPVGFGVWVRDYAAPVIAPLRTNRVMRPESRWCD